MQVSTGELINLDDDQFDALKKEQLNLKQGRDVIEMSQAQVKATSGMSNRKRRRYMLAQPCDCGSGKRAKKCCFKK